MGCLSCPRRSSIKDKTPIYICPWGLSRFHNVIFTFGDNKHDYLFASNAKIVYFGCHSLDIEGYLLLVYKREKSDSRTNSRYEIKVRLENFKTKYELDFCAVRFFWLIKNLPMERFIFYSIHLLSSWNYYFSVLMKKIVSFSMLFIIKGCRNMKHSVVFFPFIVMFVFEMNCEIFFLSFTGISVFL